MPGDMVMTSMVVHTIPGDPEENYAHPYLPAGTIGIIIQRPDTDRPRQFLVNFVGGRTYWMYANEIEPYIKSEKDRIIKGDQI
tara:strand:- start:492 stop:740 length:249 start_codon:yes stop_codon:yes gene_type:complete